MIFSQRNHIAVGVIPDADAFAGTGYSDVFSMKNYNHVTFIYVKGAQDGTTYSTLTVQACDDTTPTTRSAIAFRYKTVADFTFASGSDVPGALTDATSSGVACANTANTAVIIEVDAAALPEGYPYVQLKYVETGDNAADGCVIAIFSEPRYAGDVPISVIS